MKTPFELYEAFKIAIIDDPIANVEKNLKKFLHDMPFKKMQLNSVAFNKVCRTKTIPYSPNKTKFLMYEPITNPGTTIFFSNMVDGWYTFVYNYARLYRKRAFILGFSISDTIEYPAYSFDNFYYHKGKFFERHVHALKEEKWIFVAQGKALDIEDKRNYSRKQIKDRLNNSVLINYMRKAGYDLTDSIFYNSGRKSLLYIHDI